MGARLTTSYEDDSVRVTIFGMSGNCRRVEEAPELACTSSIGLIGENGTLWTNDELSNQQLFLRIGHTVFGKENDDQHNTTTSSVLYPMDFIPLLSWDGNANAMNDALKLQTNAIFGFERLGFGIPEWPTSASVNNHWTAFSSEYQVQWHNSSTDGRPIPGPYWEDRIYLVGARLTTSYEDDSVRVTIFGMGGSCRVEGVPELACTSIGLIGENGTLWTNDELSNQQLFLRIGHTVFGKENDDQHNTTTSSVLYPMDFIPLLSWDGNANAVSLMWTSNLTHLKNISKIELQHQLDNSPLAGLKLEFWIQPKKSFLQQTNRNVPANLTQLIQVEIPLLTGVVGHVGPQLGPFTARIMRNTSSISNQDMERKAPQSQSALLQEKVDAVICVAVYGKHSLRSIPEFVMHHANVGFSHVVVGFLEREIDGQLIDTAQDMLVDFLEDGTISLAAVSLPHMTCKTDLMKLHFYSACLHHAKGFAEYVAVFDSDEYWLPHRKAKSNELDTQRTQRFFPSIVTNDPIWKESPYPLYQSIVETMNMVHQYQKEAGCGEEWCFHTFVSLQVERKSNNVTWEQRTGRVTEDFELRGTRWDTVTHKSVTRTKYANMLGFHQPGSCRYSANQPYQRDVAAYQTPMANITLYKETGICQNLFFTETDKFGCMHHFYTVNSNRQWPTSRLGNTTKDEYVHSFGNTVQQQLNSRKEIA
ncbi:glycosyltransferase family 92 protein [Nitzschia inconspicua]|uniref:Glycosyltransferase family 92 protein n=1 Tax=Nitzschia inconspicua TaxID=303405 RepID=A0A9K3L9G3_9STRA|nr:glycosyltransferase family 92 protein [Nitzschia inconspicua]